MTEILVFALLLLCGYLFMKQVALESKVKALKEGHVDKGELEEALEQFLAEVKESNDQLLTVLSDSCEQDVDADQAKEGEQPKLASQVKDDSGVKLVNKAKGVTYGELASQAKRDPDVKFADQAKADKRMNLVNQGKSDKHAKLVNQVEGGQWDKSANQNKDGNLVNQVNGNQREKDQSYDKPVDRSIVDNRSKYKTNGDEERSDRHNEHNHHNENKDGNGQDSRLESVEEKEEFAHSTTYSQVFSLRKQGLTVEEIARDLGIGVTEVSLLLRFHEKNDENPHVSSCRESDNMV